MPRRRSGFSYNSREGKSGDYVTWLSNLERKLKLKLGAHDKVVALLVALRLRARLSRSRRCGRGDAAAEKAAG